MVAKEWTVVKAKPRANSLGALLICSAIKEKPCPKTLCSGWRASSITVLAVKTGVLRRDSAHSLSAVGQGNGGVKGDSGDHSLLVKYNPIGMVAGNLAGRTSWRAGAQIGHSSRDLI